MGKLISQLLLIVGLSLLTVGCGSEEESSPSTGFNGSPNTDAGIVNPIDVVVPSDGIQKDVKYVEGVFVDTIVVGLGVNFTSSVSGFTESSTVTGSDGKFNIPTDAETVEFFIGTNLVIGSIDVTDVHSDGSLKLIDLGKMFNTNYIYDTRVMFVSRLLLSCNTDPDTIVIPTTIQETTFSTDIVSAFATNTNLRGAQADEVLKTILAEAGITTLKTEVDAETHLKATHDKLMSKVDVTEASAEQCPSGGTVKTYSVDFSGNGVYETYTSVECAPTTVVERIKNTYLAGKETVNGVDRYFNNRVPGVDLTEVDTDGVITYEDSATTPKVFSFDSKCSDGGLKITHYQYEVGTYTIGTTPTTKAKLLGQYDEYQCSSIVRVMEMKEAKLVIENDVDIADVDYRVNVKDANGAEVGDIVYTINLISELDGSNAGTKATEIAHDRSGVTYSDFSDVTFEANNICLGGGIERNYYTVVASTEETAEVTDAIYDVAFSFAVSTTTAPTTVSGASPTISVEYSALQTAKVEKLELEAAKYVETLTDEEKTAAESAYTTYVGGDYKNAEDNYNKAILDTKTYESFKVSELAKARTDALAALTGNDNANDWGHSSYDLGLLLTSAQNLDSKEAIAETRDGATGGASTQKTAYDAAVTLDDAVTTAQGKLDSATISANSDTATSELENTYNEIKSDFENNNDTAYIQDDVDTAKAAYDDAVTLDEAVTTAQSTLDNAQTDANNDTSTSTLLARWKNAVAYENAVAAAAADSGTTELQTAIATTNELNSYLSVLEHRIWTAEDIEENAAMKTDRDNAIETYYICNTQNDGFTPGIHSVRRVNLSKTGSECNNVGGYKYLHTVDFDANGISETTQTHTVDDGTDIDYSYHEIICSEFVAPEMDKVIATGTPTELECKYGGETVTTFVYNKTVRISTPNITDDLVQTDGEYRFTTVECSDFDAHEYNLTDVTPIAMGQVDGVDTKCPYAGGKVLTTVIYAGEYTGNLDGGKTIPNNVDLTNDIKVISTYESTFCYGDKEINTFENHKKVGSVKMVDEFTSCQDVEVTVYRHSTYTNYISFADNIAEADRTAFEVTESGYTSEVCTKETVSEVKTIYVQSNVATIIDAKFELPVCKDANGVELEASATVATDFGILANHSSLGVTLSEIETAFRLVTIQTTDNPTEVKITTICNGETQVNEYNIIPVPALTGFEIAVITGTTNPRQFTFDDAETYATQQCLSILTVEEYETQLAIGTFTQFGDFWTSTPTTVLENGIEVDMPIAISIRSDLTSQTDENQAKANRKFVAFKTDTSCTLPDEVDFIVVGGANPIQANWKTASEICENSGLTLPNEGNFTSIYFRQNNSSVAPQKPIQNGEYWTNKVVEDILNGIDLGTDANGDPIALEGDSTNSSGEIFIVSSNSYDTLIMNQANYKNIICVGTNLLIAKVTTISGSVLEDDGDDSTTIGSGIENAQITLTKQGMPVINGLETITDGSFTETVDVYALSGYVIEVQAEGYYKYSKTITLDSSGDIPTIELIKRDTQVDQPDTNPLTGNVNNGCESVSEGVTCNFLSADWEITEVNGDIVGENQLKSDVTKWKYELTNIRGTLSNFTVGLDAVTKAKATAITEIPNSDTVYAFEFVTDACPSGIIWSVGVKAPLRLNFTSANINNVLVVDVPTPICKADVTKVTIKVLDAVTGLRIKTITGLKATNEQFEVTATGYVSKFIGISGGNDTFETTVELIPTKTFTVNVTGVAAGENVSVRIAGFETQTTNEVASGSTSIVVPFEDVPYGIYDIEVIYDGRNIVEDKVKIGSSSSITIDFPTRQDADSQSVTKTGSVSASSCFSQSFYTLDLVYVSKNTSYQFNFNAQKSKGDIRLNSVTIDFGENISNAIKNISRGGRLITADGTASNDHITWEVNGGGNFEFNLVNLTHTNVNLGTVTVHFNTASTDSTPNVEFDLTDDTATTNGLVTQ